MSKSPSRKSGKGASGSVSRGPSGRGLHVRVKTARGRKTSSLIWLQRQLNDPYVRQAKAAGFRSRAALKVVDLGAAPGGWTQVAVERVRAGTPKGGLVVGIDINAWDKVTGATCITMDFMDNGAPDVLKKALGGKSDVVLSDMASPATGHPGTDHIRIMALAELAWAFAEEVLAPGGTFICKVFQGGTEGDLLKQIKNCFSVVKHAKPPASRKDSAEVYLAAMGFKA